MTTETIPNNGTNGAYYPAYGTYRWEKNYDYEGLWDGTYSLRKDVKSFTTISLPSWFNGLPPPDDYPLNFCCPKCDIPKCEYEQYYQTLSACSKGLKHIKNPLLMIFGKFTTGYLTPGGGSYALNESPVMWLGFQLTDPTPLQKQDFHLNQGNSPNLATRNARFLSGHELRDNRSWSVSPWPYDYPIPEGPQYPNYSKVPIPGTGTAYEDPEGATLYYKFTKVSTQTLNLGDSDDAIQMTNFIANRSYKYYAFDEVVQYPVGSPNPIVDTQVQRLDQIDVEQDLDSFTELQIPINNNKYMGFSHIHMSRYIKYAEDPNNPPVMVGLRLTELFNYDNIPGYYDGTNTALPNAPKHGETWLAEFILKYRTPKPIRFKVVCQYYVGCELNEQIICSEEIIGETYAERFCMPFVYKEATEGGTLYYETFAPTDQIPNLYKGALYHIVPKYDPYCTSGDEIIDTYDIITPGINRQINKPSIPLTFADYGAIGTLNGGIGYCHSTQDGVFLGETHIDFSVWVAAIGDNSRVLGRMFLKRIPSRPAYKTDALTPVLDLQADNALTVACYNMSTTWATIPFSYPGANNDAIIPYKLSPCRGNGQITSMVVTPDGDGSFGVVGAQYDDNVNEPPAPITVGPGGWVGSSVTVPISGINLVYAFSSKTVQPPFYAPHGAFGYPLPGQNPFYLNEKLFMCRGYHKWDRHMETVNLRIEAQLCKERLIKLPYVAQAMRYMMQPVNYGDDPAAVSQNATDTVDFKYNTTYATGIATADGCQLVGFDESVVTEPRHYTLLFKDVNDPNRLHPWVSCEGLGFASLQDTVDCLNITHNEYFPDKYSPGVHGNYEDNPKVGQNPYLATDTIWSVPYRCWKANQANPDGFSEAACARDWCDGPFLYGIKHRGYMGVYTNVAIPEFGGAAFSYSSEKQPWPGVEPDSSSSKSSASYSSKSSVSQSSVSSHNTIPDDGEESYNDSSHSTKSSNTSSSNTSSSNTSSSFPSEDSSSGEDGFMPRKAYIFKVLAPELQAVYVGEKCPNWYGNFGKHRYSYHYAEWVNYSRGDPSTTSYGRDNMVWKCLISNPGTSLIYGFPPAAKFF